MSVRQYPGVFLELAHQFFSEILHDIRVPCEVVCVTEADFLKQFFLQILGETQQNRVF